LRPHLLLMLLIEGDHPTSLDRTSLDAGEGSGPRRRPRQELLDLDGDLVAADDDGAFGDRQVVGEDADFVFLGSVKLDNGAAAETEHLVDRHGGRTQHHRNIDRDILECRHGAPFRFVRYSVGPIMVTRWLTRAAT